MLDDDAVGSLSGDAGTDWFVINGIGGAYMDRATGMSAF